MKLSLLQNNSQKLLTSQTKHSSNGKKMEKSRLKEQKEDIEGTSMTCQTSHCPKIVRIIKKHPSSMQESHRENKKMTLKDKLNSYNPNIQTIQLSKTLDQASTSNEEDSLPFWTRSLEETYKKLWLPIETDFQDLDLSYSNTSSKDSKLPLPFCQMNRSKTLSMTSQKTSYQSLQFSQPDTMDQGPMIKCRKLRIYPNKEQTALFNKCLGASRFFYNESIRVINEVGVTGTKILQRKNLRPLVMKSDKNVDETMEWQKEVPYDTRQEAISDAITSYKGCLTKLQNGTIQHFHVGFRSKKKQTSQAFTVNKRALNLENMTIFPNRLKDKKGKLRMRKRDREKKKLYFNAQKQVDGNFTILKTRPCHWYLCLPQKVNNVNEDKNENETRSNKSVFLDPGVRTFQTIYSPDGVCGKIGLPKLNQELKRISDTHDKLWSVSDKAKGQSNKEKKQNLKKRCSLLRKKLKDKVNDLHWQTCALLCNSFKYVFLPHFRVSDMVNGSPLGSSITRKMLQLSHGAFKEKISYYARTKQCNLTFVNEHYTTKTCSCCGRLQQMDGLKQYNCDQCNTSIDRDYNAARNICLKLLTKLM